MARFGTGTTIAWTTTTAYNAFEVTSLTQDGREVAIADSTHMESTTSRSKLAGTLPEPGTFTAEILHDPDIAITLGGAGETVTITYNKLSGQSSGATDQGTAVIQSVSESIPLEDVMTATVTGQWLALPTRSAGS